MDGGRLAAAAAAAAAAIQQGAAAGGLQAPQTQHWQASKALLCRLAGAAKGEEMNESGGGCLQAGWGLTQASSATQQTTGGVQVGCWGPAVVAAGSGSMADAPMHC